MTIDKEVEKCIHAIPYLTCLDTGLYKCENINDKCRYKIPWGENFDFAFCRLYSIPLQQYKKPLKT